MFPPKPNFPIQLISNQNFPSYLFDSWILHEYFKGSLVVYEYYDSFFSVYSELYHQISPFLTTPELRINIAHLINHKYQIETKLRQHQQNLLIYGIIVGPYTDQNYYHLRNFDFYVIHVYDFSTHQFLSYTELLEFNLLFDLTILPVLGNGFTDPSVPKLEEHLKTYNCGTGVGVSISYPPSPRFGYLLRHPTILPSLFLYQR